MCAMLLLSCLVVVAVSGIFNLQVFLLKVFSQLLVWLSAHSH
jgi:hypothetical protein